MTLVTEAIARLKARVPDLGNRVEAAANYATLMKSGGVPQAAIVAHVLFTGIGGGTALPLTGIYTQKISRLLSVILTVNTGNAQGGHWLDRAEAVIDAILAALLGWQPSGASGICTLRRSQLVDATGGVFRYELTFSCDHDLRII
jgi:hypothetical protein